MAQKIFTALSILFLASCSIVGGGPKVEPVALGNKVSLSNSSKVKSQLYAQHREWKGTKYRLGGLSKSGIDCSGFVYTTFKSRLGYELPRSTKLQADLGKKISKNELRAGDLVFFKTGIKVRHVGIYLENNKFLHASTSKGVMISRLDNVYWKRKYWMAKRL